MKNEKKLCDYLFIKLLTDINTVDSVQITKENLPAVFDMNITEAKKVALKLLGGSKDLFDFPYILQQFFAVYCLWLQINKEDYGSAQQLINDKYTALIKASLKNDKIGFEELKENINSSNSKKLKSASLDLYNFVDNIAHDALKMMIPPQEGIKNWCISGYCRENKENNMILWEDYFWTLIQWNLEWMIDVLIQAGLDLHSRFARRVLVDSCCLYNKPLMLRAMLERGLDITIPIYETLVLEVVGWNRADDTTILKILIDHGLNINIPSPTGTNFDMCAINIALCVPHVNMAKMLLENGADVNFKDREGYNALYHILSGIWKTPCESPELLELMDMVIARGADLNVVGKDGRSAVYQCAVNGFEKFLDKILINGGDINVKHRNDDTPLILAVKKGEIFAIQFLIDKGADINAVDNIGYSALHHAVRSALTNKGIKKEQLAIIKLFMKNGIDKELQTVKAKKVKKQTLIKGSTALDLAKLLKIDEVIAIID